MAMERRRRERRLWWVRLFGGVGAVGVAAMCAAVAWRWAQAAMLALDARRLRYVVVIVVGIGVVWGVGGVVALRWW